MVWRQQIESVSIGKVCRRDSPSISSFRAVRYTFGFQLHIPQALTTRIYQHLDLSTLEYTYAATLSSGPLPMFPMPLQTARKLDVMLSKSENVDQHLCLKGSACNSLISDG